MSNAGTRQPPRPRRFPLLVWCVVALLGQRLLASIPATDGFTGTFTTNWDTIVGAYTNTGGEAVAQNSGENIASWKVATDDFGDDQCSEAKFTTISTGGNFVGVRVAGTNNTDVQGYLFGSNGASGSASQVYLMTGGTSYVALGAVYGAIVTNDTIGLQIVGSTLTPFINGVAQATRSDPSLGSGGQPGLYTYDPGAFDNWQGGNTCTGSSSTVHTFGFSHFGN